MMLPSRTRERQRILEKAEGKITDELEISTLLKKVRESYNLIKNMQMEEHEFLNHYMKEKVIDVDEETESPDEGDNS